MTISILVRTVQLPNAGIKPRERPKSSRKRGRALSPILIDALKIAKTFWGKAWCENLERYSDYANRLPRGRSYVRNGSVLDLQIEPCVVSALVSGTRVYEVEVKIAAIPQLRWKAICTDCAGQIDSIVELLRGQLSNAVMSRLCREKDRHVSLAVGDQAQMQLP
jgi:hypothetical protein